MSVYKFIAVEVFYIFGLAVVQVCAICAPYWFKLWKAKHRGYKAK